MGRWSSFVYGGDEKGAKNRRPSQNNLSPFLEEESDSREMESWEHSKHDDDSLSDESEMHSIESSVSSLTGGGNRKPRIPVPPPRAKDPLMPQSKRSNKAALGGKEEKVEVKDVERGTRVSLVAAPPVAPEQKTGRSSRLAGVSAAVNERFQSVKSKMSFRKTDSAAGSLKSTQKARNAQRRIYYFWGGLALVVFVAIIAGSIVAAQRKGGSDDAKESSPPLVDDADVALNAREQSLMNIFVTVSAQGLDVVNSPQYKAKEWMFHEDLLVLTPSAIVSPERIAQRYALAVFYFSTNGSESWSTNNWLLGDECSNMYWNGISCNENNEVRALAFDNAGLAGTIPEEIGAFTLLENLVVKNHPKITGKIPMSIGQLKILGQLGLYNNALTGGIPNELYKATHLNYINLQNNQLEGGLILQIERLRNLERLILFNNNFSGGVPFRQLARTGIRFLGLSNNNFVGPIPEQISNLPLLEYLYLDGNNFSGPIHSNFGRLMNLVSFNFDHNSFSGGIPTEMGGMKSLEYASVEQNSLTGEIPTEIASLAKLRTLNFGDNVLTGKIPDLSSLSSLKHLHLHQNELTGEIPASLGQLSNLEVLFLSSNNFEGYFDQILGAANLKGLYLSDNRLGGTIPEGLCELDTLRALFLDSNLFSGPVPECIGTLTDLRQLFLFSNKLTGALPDSLGELRKLTGFGIEDNDIGGHVPGGVCTIGSLSDIWADCGGQVPEILCSCCSTCCPSPNCK